MGGQSGSQSRTPLTPLPQLPLTLQSSARCVLVFGNVACDFHVQHYPTTPLLGTNPHSTTCIVPVARVFVRVSVEITSISPIRNSRGAGVSWRGGGLEGGGGLAVVMSSLSSVFASASDRAFLPHMFRLVILQPEPNNKICLPLSPNNGEM